VKHFGAVLPDRLRCRDPGYPFGGPIKTGDNTFTVDRKNPVGNRTQDYLQEFQIVVLVIDKAISILISA